MTHDELMHDLANHLRSPDKMVWTDMKMGPSGSQRPDVFTMMKSYTQPKPMTYEIKVSVSDFRQDVTAGKWHGYLDYSSGVYFACPSGMITKADLPQGAGLIVRGENGWKVMKAPTLKPVYPGFEVMQKLLIDGVNRTEPELRKQRWEEWLKTALINKRMGKATAEALLDLRSTEQKLADIQVEIDMILARAWRQADQIQKEANTISNGILEVYQGLCELCGIKPDTTPSLFSINRLKHGMQEMEELYREDQKVQLIEILLNGFERDLIRARKDLKLEKSEHE